MSADFCPFCHAEKTQKLPLCRACWALIPLPARISILEARRVEFTPTPGPQFTPQETLSAPQAASIS